MGAKKATSTSKRRKRIASKKNFIQKGTWEDPMGSKPHSKGENVSETGQVNKVIKDEERRRAEKVKTNKE